MYLRLIRLGVEKLMKIYFLTDHWNYMQYKSLTLLGLTLVLLNCQLVLYNHLKFEFH